MDLDDARKLYVLWRVDEDDFILTILDLEHSSKPLNEIIELCIRDEYKDHSELTLQGFIRTALDPEDPNYMGYEMPMSFLANPDHLEFL
jgi:hypothetical protein